MKKKLIYSMTVIFGALFFSCKENTDLFLYDQEKPTVYFGLKYAVNSGSINTAVGIDSLEFSFTSIDVESDSHIIKVPVHISGNASDTARPYGLQVVAEDTNLEKEYYSILRSEIGAGLFVDTLEVEIYKHEELQEVIKRLTLRLQANEYFDEGYVNNQQIKMDLSNVLLKPEWWDTWESVFGPYSHEKYQMWTIIYHEKADGYLDYTYNYKNMPGRALQAWYPSTFSFISQLKDYFEKNIVYEGGNPDNPRVRIPYQF